MYTLTNISSFRFYRTPPIVLEVIGPLPDVSTPAGRQDLRANGSPLAFFEPPIHILVANQAAIRNSKLIKSHLMSSELPFESLRDTSYGISVASPLLTLLSLATSLSRTHLTMAMYELCGTFTVYRPAPSIRPYLQELVDTRLLPVVGGWQPMLAQDGKLTDLWRRPPLVDIDELHTFAEHMEGAHGIDRFRTAAKNVHGIAASPFEVQAALLLGLPRRLGGKGLGPFEHNREIALTRDAQRIAGQRRAYSDLYLEGSALHPPITIECQGQEFHGTTEQATSDDNRRLALQSMGITVVPLRYEQIYEPTKLDAVAAYLAKLTSKRLRPLTLRLQDLETELRREILIDWWTLGA